MEIKYNNDKSVTINATSAEYSAICGAVATMYGTVNSREYKALYKSIMDAINTAYNEQVSDEGL